MLCYFQLVVFLRLLHVYCQFTLIWYKAFSRDLSKYMLCINNTMSLFYILPLNRSKCLIVRLYKIRTSWEWKQIRFRRRPKERRKLSIEKPSFRRKI